jgi:hypothetical protein
MPHKNIGVRSRKWTSPNFLTFFRVVNAVYSLYRFLGRLDKLYEQKFIDVALPDLTPIWLGAMQNHPQFRTHYRICRHAP